MVYRLSSFILTVESVHSTITQLLSKKMLRKGTPLEAQKE